MADNAGYDIFPYRGQNLEAVSELMVHLWGPDPAVNAEYFAWKYARNPYSHRTLGIVAACDGRVVGFRGFFATKWRTPDGDDFLLLAPGDTCVDPGHRRKGLSVEMGRRAMEEYGLRYRVLLNMSCSASSIPGYLRMGFKPLTSREYLTWGTSLSLAAAFVPGRGSLRLRSRLLGHSFKPRGTAHGEEVAVDSQPRPREMARVAAAQKDDGRLALIRDERFFTWRYGSNRRYLFYSLSDGQEMRSYLALRLSRDFRAQVVDHAGSSEDVATLVQHVAGERRFGYLSIWAFSVGEDLMAGLLRLGFRQDRLSRLVERRVSGEGGLPLLVRPSTVDPAEEDWEVGGLRIDRIGNWSIRAIASDAN